MSARRRFELADLMREAISMRSEAIRGGVRLELADLDGLGQLPLRSQVRILHRPRVLVEYYCNLGRGVVVRVRWFGDGGLGWF
jgi:hypothetical protein